MLSRSSRLCCAAFLAFATTLCEPRARILPEPQEIHSRYPYETSGLTGEASLLDARPLQFTYEGRRDRTRFPRLLLPPLQVRHSPCASSSATALGDTDTYSSRRARRCAARAACLPLTRLSSPEARSRPLSFTAASHWLAAVERIYLSPCPLTNPLICTGRSGDMVGDVSHRQQAASTAVTASRAPRGVRCSGRCVVLACSA